MAEFDSDSWLGGVIAGEHEREGAVRPLRSCEHCALHFPEVDRWASDWVDVDLGSDVPLTLAACAEHFLAHVWPPNSFKEEVRRRWWIPTLVRERRMAREHILTVLVARGAIPVWGPKFPHLALRTFRRSDYLLIFPNESQAVPKQPDL